MRLRAPRSDDCEVLTELCGELGYPSTRLQVARRLDAISGLSGHLLLVAADEGDRPVGWIHAVMAHRLSSDPTAEVTGMVVARPQRSRGIGAQLLGAAEDWARSAGLGVIRVRSNVIRQRAHDFYLAAGYTRHKTSHVFTKSLPAKEPVARVATPS